MTSAATDVTRAVGDTARRHVAAGDGARHRVVAAAGCTRRRTGRAKRCSSRSTPRCRPPRITATMRGFDSLPVADPDAAADGDPVVIDVDYDGEDLDTVAAATGMPRDEVVRRHSAVTYRAEFCGFAPGSPISPVSTPPSSCRGATRHAPPFRPARSRSPTATRPCTRRPRRAGGTCSGAPTPCCGTSDGPTRRRSGPARRCLPPGTRRRRRDSHRHGVDRAASPARRRRRPRGDRRRVVDVGAGRRAPRVRPPRRVAVGRRRRVPPSRPQPPARQPAGGGGGRDDRWPRRCAALRATVVAESSSGAVTTLAPGDEIRVDPRPGELWATLAVRGGVATAPTLGSRSWDSLARIGPPPPAVGTVLATGADPRTPIDAVLAPPEPMSERLGLLAGPRRDWFDDDAWSTLVTASWQVTDAVSRVGVRLRGPRLERVAARRGSELASEGLIRGAMQVPPDGQPVVVLADHPTTGGYPVVAVVDDRAVDELARLGPRLAGAIRDRDDLTRSRTLAGIACRTWSGASTDSRTSTASRARSAASAASAPTRWPATCSAGSCRGAAAPTCSSRTAPACTSTSGRTPSTPRPSATRCTTSSCTTRPASGSSRAWSSRPSSASPRKSIRGTIYLFKNNTDSAGNSYGCHENYLTRRSRRPRPLRRGADPVLRQPPDLRRRRQGAAHRPRRDVLDRPARRAHLGGRSARRPPAAARSSTPATSRTPTPSATAASTSSSATPT